MAYLPRIAKLRGGFVEAVLPALPHKPLTRDPRATHRPKLVAATCLSHGSFQETAVTRAAPRSSAGPTSLPAPPLSKWTGNSPHSAGVGVVSSVGVQNGRAKPHNQDAFIVEALHPAPSAAATLIGIFDGHGAEGHFAAQHISRMVASAVHKYAQQALSFAPVDNRQSWDDYSSSSNLRSPTALAHESALADFTLAQAQSCLEATFSRTAESVAEAQCDLTKSGSTAVVCMVLPDSVVAAWAGDSRAVMGTGEDGCFVATQLTQDHKPSKLSEMARIVAAGGRVARPATDRRGHPTGPFRVCLPGATTSGLSVARAFGDLELSAAGVVPTPDFAVFPRSSSAAPSGQHPAELLIVASDGLWEVVGNQEAVDIAASADSAEEGAQRLVDAARRQWAARYGARHCDDITVAVAFL